MRPETPETQRDMDYDFTFNDYGFNYALDTDVDGTGGDKECYEVYDLIDDTLIGEIPVMDYFNEDGGIDEDKLIGELVDAGIM